jgi:hypothetical protein
MPPTHAANQHLMVPLLLCSGWWFASQWLREDLSPVQITVTASGSCKAHVHKVAIQDVCTVPRAVHPAFMHSRWSAVAVCYVFTLQTEQRNTYIPQCLLSPNQA